PQISLLVPLFHERDIAGHLIKRLRRIDYPRERLDVMLVIEAGDTTTRATLAATDLPAWMRVIDVPEGSIQTKPRALNYALDHCNGSIIGVYDAEDAPEPDQLLRVAATFATAPADVGCLQGVLDFYNPHQNWLARCFAVEYASWFRVILPGYEKLGLVLPLGGTTIFFRRDVLEHLRGWDAHNVTEDADLGVRLARHGYRTQFINSTTYEEANCRAVPWIRQRSRWLKGYIVTYAVHMRRPLALLRDLGPWRFFGVQVLFLGTITQFTLAPLLWSFWAAALGLGHPVAAALPGWVWPAMVVLFIASELLAIAIGMMGVAATRHTRLARWVPTLHVYFPLGSAAIYKAFAEMLWKPFYWDKTAHGTAHAPTSSSAADP
ncbi:MAG: glycosyltransferase, partial [Pseudomonadota bacterium]